MSSKLPEDVLDFLLAIIQYDYDWDDTVSAARSLLDEYKPRPIQIGDKVTWGNSQHQLKVVAVHNTWAWCCVLDGPHYGDDFGTYEMKDLTRVDDE